MNNPNEIINSIDFVHGVIDTMDAMQNQSAKSLYLMDNQLAIKKNISLLQTSLAVIPETDPLHGEIEKALVEFNNTINDYKQEAEVKEEGHDIAQEMHISEDDVHEAIQTVQKDMASARTTVNSNIPNYMCYVMGKVLMFRADTKEEINDYLDKVIIRYGSNTQVQLFAVSYTPVPLKDATRRTVVIA